MQIVHQFNKNLSIKWYKGILLIKFKCNDIHVKDVIED